tara:strand:+ start:28587 stop:29471 length:885 start_codon:yes stop_codon:yes gene_type:complete
MIITYLGPMGTFTEEAAIRLQPTGERRPIDSLELVAQSLTDEGIEHDGERIQAELGVMAYYNRLKGLVQECLDSIYERGLHIVGAQRLPIVLSIGTHPDAESGSTIYTHPKAFAQSSVWLSEHVPGARFSDAGSTAGGAEYIGEGNSGFAIGPRIALEMYGLEIIAEGVENEIKNGGVNFTDFYLVSREGVGEFVEGIDYQTMVAITPPEDRPGLLAEILNQVAYHGINNAKIHSRPAIDWVDIEEAQMFYLEMDTHEGSDDFRRCVDTLRYKLAQVNGDDVVRVLGSYPRPSL